MTTQETAARCQELVLQRKFIEVQDDLYHEDVVCQEPETDLILPFTDDHRILTGWSFPERA